MISSTTLKYGTFINLNLKPLMESPSSASRSPKQTFAGGDRVSSFIEINYLELQINVVELDIYYHIILFAHNTR